MICKKVIEVDRICCNVCGKEMETANTMTCMALLHKAFLSGSVGYSINPLIEDSQFCLCSECVHKYGDEIFKHLLDSLDCKLTELKLRSRN